MELFLLKSLLKPTLINFLWYLILDIQRTYFCLRNAITKDCAIQLYIVELSWITTQYNYSLLGSQNLACCFQTTHYTARCDDNTKQCNLFVINLTLWYSNTQNHMYTFSADSRSYKSNLSLCRNTYNVFSKCLNTTELINTHKHIILNIFPTWMFHTITEYKTMSSFSSDNFCRLTKNTELVLSDFSDYLHSCCCF